MAESKDRIETLNGARIQHGKGNDRVYLMKLGSADPDAVITGIEELAAREDYSKIFCKVPRRAADAFARRGYETEARIPGFYNGSEDVHFMSRFLQNWRLACEAEEQHRQVLEAARAKAGTAIIPQLEEDLRFAACEPGHADDIAALYRLVFASYPFPIHDPEYIRETMASHVVYYGIWKNDHLVALSSAEMDEAASNVEMTDFATHPDHRGAGYGLFLLDHMDKAMRDRGLLTAYTIARSVSFGMNITFAKLGYEFAGTLRNNTDICGSFECMNIWFKPLR